MKKVEEKIIYTYQENGVNIQDFETLDQLGKFIANRHYERGKRETEFAIESAKKNFFGIGFFTAILVISIYLLIFS